MKIDELVTLCNGKQFMIAKTRDEEITKFLRDTLEIKDYLPLVQKQAIAQVVLEACTTMKDGYMRIDSLQKYMIFTLTILTQYTNLELAGDETDIEVYDALCANKLGGESILNWILKIIEKDYAICMNVLNMLANDLLEENQIGRQISKFLGNLTQKIDAVGKLMSDANIDVSQIDIDKLANAIDQIKK